MLKLSGVEKIKFSVSSDMRGKSYKIMSPEIISKYIPKNFTQQELFISESEKNVIRGLHVQSKPYGQQKAIFLIEGKITGVILDLRGESDTYLKYDTIELDKTCGYGVFVPKYCAWGFKVKEKSTLVYSIEGIFSREHDEGVLWNSIDYDWNLETPSLSDRDRALPTLEKYISMMENA